MFHCTPCPLHHADEALQQLAAAWRALSAPSAGGAA